MDRAAEKMVEVRVEFGLGFGLVVVGGGSDAGYE
jgi:hypothetical protein